jgi:hypothetical protein
VRAILNQWGRIGFDGRLPVGMERRRIAKSSAIVNADQKTIKKQLMNGFCAGESIDWPKIVRSIQFFRKKQL